MRYMQYVTCTLACCPHNRVPHLLLCTLQVLKASPNLRSLCLEAQPLAPSRRSDVLMPLRRSDLLKAVPQLAPKLTSFSLRNCKPDTQDVLALLAGLPGLVSLSLPDWSATGTHSLDALLAAEHLTHLEVSNGGAGDRAARGCELAQQHR